MNYSKIFKNLPDMCAVVLPNHPIYTIVAANKAYIERTNSNEKEIIGKSIFEAFSRNLNDDDKQKVIDSIHFAVLTKHITSSPIIRYDIEKDGIMQESYWIGRTIPILDENNEVEYLLRCPTHVMFPKK